MCAHPEQLRGPDQRDTSHDYYIARRAIALAQELGYKITQLADEGPDTSTLLRIADELEAEVLYRISSGLNIDKDAWDRAAKDL